MDSLKITVGRCFLASTSIMYFYGERYLLLLTDLLKLTTTYYYYHLLTVAFTVHYMNTEHALRQNNNFAIILLEPFFPLN